MSLSRWLGSAAVAGMTALAPLAAQDASYGVAQVIGGGYSHIANLNSAGTAHFNTGYNLGLALGLGLNRYASAHVDFTFTRNRGLGDTPFTGSVFHRYFYGAHVEARYPFEGGVAPFAFLGGGGVTIDQQGTGGLASFTKPAAMFGVGLAYAIPRSSVEVLMEGKGLAYKWDRGGFNKTQFDVTYSVGLAYRFGT